MVIVPREIRSTAADLIGVCAAAWIAQVQRGQVLGRTSSGAFVLLENGRVIFISPQGGCGPLTVACRDVGWLVDGLRVGDQVSIAGRSGPHDSPGDLVFERSAWRLRLDRAATWRLLPGQGQPVSRLARRAYLQQVSRLVLAASPQTELTGLLAGLTGEAGSGPLPTAAADLYQHAYQLCQVLAQAPQAWASALAPTLLPFMGRGRGLTPSGDDLVVGMLLALNRWGKRLYPRLDRAGLNRAVLEQMKNRSGALSLSLAMAAADGQADERLAAGVDAIVLGGMPAEDCVSSLRGWGSSSGLDALVGMAVLLME